MADDSFKFSHAEKGLGHWHPSQQVENDASELEPGQLELPL
jgi:hypothetical protein